MPTYDSGYLWVFVWPQRTIIPLGKLKTAHFSSLGFTGEMSK